MLKRTVVIFAAAAFFWGAVPTQSALARDYYDDDDIWDLMNTAGVRDTTAGIESANASNQAA